MKRLFFLVFLRLFVKKRLFHQVEEQRMRLRRTRLEFLMELAGLKGREKLKDYDVESLIVYEGK